MVYKVLVTLHKKVQGNTVGGDFSVVQRFFKPQSECKKGC